MEHIQNIDVVDRQSFIVFLDNFLKDYQQNKENWENTTLETFLEALSAYTHDIQGYYDNIEKGGNADIPTWKVFADILSGASIYE